MTRKPSSRTCMSAGTKKHLRIADARKLMFVSVFGRGFAQVVEAETVEGVGIGVDGAVGGDGVGGGKCESSRGEKGAVGQGDGTEDFALECDCWRGGQLGPWKSLGIL